MAFMVGIMRAWHANTSTYVYWAVTQIEYPIYEYPGGGLPLVTELTDFILMGYITPTLTNIGTEIDITWDRDTADGYAVGIYNTGMPSYLPIATPSSTAIGTYPNRFDGVASGLNKVKTAGSYLVYADSPAAPGDVLYISEVNAGMVSALYPSSYVIPAGVSMSYKTDSTPELIRMLIQIQPIIPPVP